MYTCICIYFMASGKPTGEHTVEHTDDGYHCTICQLTGQELKSQPCPGKPKETLGTGETHCENENTKELDERELILEQLLQEEVELSNLLEEALALSKHTSDAVGLDGQQEDDPEFQQAIALSMQVSHEKVQEKDEETVEKNKDEDEGDEDLQEAIQLSMQTLPNTESTKVEEVLDAPSPAAGKKAHDTFSETDLYNMQCIINLGFSKGQAIWGIKRANEGDGSVDLALQHASWKLDAEILMAKRQKLDDMVRQGKPQVQPESNSVQLQSSQPTSSKACHTLSLCCMLLCVVHVGM